MKKITLIFTVLALAITSILSSCDDDKEFIAPVANGIAIAPMPCYVGDTILLFVTYETKGQYWYYTQQRYTLDGEEIMFKTKPDKGVLNTNGEYKYVLKKEGIHTLTFSSQISVYVGTGSPFLDGPSTTVKFEVLPREDKPEQDNQ